MRLAVIIPAHNEAKTIGDVVERIPKQVDGISRISTYVVNDASFDETASIAKKTGAIVISHRLNLGAGGAILTGLLAAKRQDCEVAVSLDGDGQHDPDDIHALVSEYRTNKADLIIGSRFLSETIGRMPPLKWYGNKAMNGITYTFCGARVTDSQSGFRLFGKNILSMIEQFSMTGYEFCSETIINAKRFGLEIAEVPIKTIYFNERRGQNPINGLNIILRLLYRTVAG